MMPAWRGYFATPGQCFATYIRALDSLDTELAMECFFQDESDSSRAIARSIKAVVPMAGLIRMMDSSDGGSSAGSIKPGKVEFIGENEARLNITIGDSCADEFIAMELLALAAGVSNYDRDDCWLPLRRTDGIWSIDLPALRQTAFARSHETSDRKICQTNLKQIGLALLMYSQDYDGKTPSDLSRLEPYLRESKACSCPGDRTTVGDGSKPGFRSSYTYIRHGSIGSANASRLIMAYDSSPDFHEGGRNVLFMDAHVRWYDEAEFRKLLKQQEALRAPLKPVVRKKAKTTTRRKTPAGAKSGKAK